MIHVAVIEDNRFLRDGLTSKLNEQEEITVCYSAASGTVQELGDAAPQVLLLDVGLEEKYSLEIAEQIQS